MPPLFCLNPNAAANDHHKPVTAVIVTASLRVGEFIERVPETGAQFKT